MTRSIKADVLSHFLEKVLDEEEKVVADDPDGFVELDDDGNPIAPKKKPKRELTDEEKLTCELMQGIFMAAISGDQHLVRAIRGGLIITAGLHNWCQRAPKIAMQVNLKIGYIAGTFQPDIGNKILEVFAVEHPYFGTFIPDAQTTMLDMARVVDDQYRMARTREEEVRRKKSKGKELGVAIPDAEKEVTSADATALLKAMRDKEVAAKLAAHARIEAAEKDRIADERALKLAAGSVREDVPFDF